MDLYIANLETLRGFYQSSVYVIAESREAALTKLIAAVRFYALMQTEDMGGYCRYTEVDQDDPNWPDQFELFMMNVEAEAQRAMTLIPGGVLVEVRI